MMSKTVREIAELYTSYFKGKGHTIVPSSSLIPKGDPTLLFTTAGMVQFKPLFTGAVELPYTRAASVQKCVRTTDLEVVGKTERHCTFFEMLGNFSFGDYFKKEAIEYALDFSLNHLHIPKEKIWVTIYLDDDEAKKIWMEAGIPEERIVRLGKKDNFWGPAGDSGACGPCSELYLDRGPEKGGPNCGNNPSCKPGCDCDRYLEYWNLVFNQFNQTVSGELLPLKQTGIDTGSGLERVAMLLQEVDSVYDTDELKSIIRKIEELSGKTYDESTKQSFRVITDHSRSVFFSLGDGIYPDRTGRGYVIRRLIRRASLFARKLGIHEPFLYKLVGTLRDLYSVRYPELKDKAKDIESVLKKEEELFLHTLEVGLEELESLLNHMKSTNQTVVTGKEGFRLYSTYGFPREMTKELVEDRGFGFDDKGFEEELEKDRDLSRASWKGKKVQYLTGLTASPELKTEFLGYTEIKSKAKVLYLFVDGKSVKEVNQGMEAVVVLDKTPFYAEGGGQIGDWGYLKKEGFQFQVQDTQKENETFLHLGIILKGKISVGETIEAEIDTTRRQKLANHHSGTHLLNGALRRILGTHVAQKGSIVSSDYLRFDFSHPKALSEEEIISIEKDVNEAVNDQIPVKTEVLDIEAAKQSGALSMFDEKYGSSVRVISMGEKSKEFCGGTHVSNTKEIGYFAIIKEGSPGAGNRRVEAICGDSVIEYFLSQFQTLAAKVETHNLSAKENFGDLKEYGITTVVPAPEDLQNLFSKEGNSAVLILRKLREDLETELEEKSSALFKAKKKKEQMSFQMNPELVDGLLKKAHSLSKGKVVTEVFEAVDAKSLKDLADSLKAKEPEVLCLFGTRDGEASTLVFMCNKVLNERGIHCGDLLKETLVMLDGKGGGRPDMAQGGGKKPESLGAALEFALELSKKKLG
ncbi:alanine--tRNA ligase [Leptospira sp. 2 VSF19]|uniref:Alanine--tRNA ligase n=1 Tax=Leptospira soteropolitanensis TaxID=2950025 RepID=A0AAW5VHN1_9LEPT|nr:alanine--tRNA ligase [Leptospira soteropolitanensis]MCW7492866.1 alanine--tRNA ligase [Leptospira soteropolitanensis]MCW7500101.1 alanine--tRNA ligase [Leptospira soteropolitanensis]MCW7522352.1 alanine--tRNA ligase [Leptospira soteropolitanensis]MCW7526208.1 alanine--tRNA ligase [Leptospira soteropolitanensis]MCW7529680.1 alanine--tRNA ligase [Leptospira soteropolitanensis]